MRRARLAAVPLALALLLAACGGDDGAEDATGTGDATTAVAPETTAGATTAPPTTAAPTTAAPVTTAPAPTAAPMIDPATGLPAVRLTEVARLEEPVAFAARTGDPAVYVAERPGRVRAIRDGRLDPEPILDISGLTRAGGERGLLGIAFAPDGEHLYVNYTDLQGHTRVAEYAVGADGTADPGSARELLRQEQPYSNHNGGHLIFGPDGMLYIGLGDGGAQGDPERRSTDPGTWLGKLLRIDPRPDGDRPYTVPADNPWADGRDGYLPEIWATGLRNPWRYSFDRATGDFWVADVGQNAVEEIDVVPADPAGTGKGVFYGWSALEGDRVFNTDVSAEGANPPAYTYLHGGTPGGCSVTGGFVYRGAAMPALQGTYLFADYCTTTVRALKPKAGGGFEEVALVDGAPNVVSFGEDANGELYVLSLGTGAVWRLDPA